METKEELLKPRYKQLNDWPFMGSKYSIGKIFTFDRDIDTDIILQYPHLFKPLQWWENRLPSQMPEYMAIAEKIVKVRKHFSHSDFLPSKEGFTSGFESANIWPKYYLYSKSQPATLEEYQSFNQNKVK